MKDMLDIPQDKATVDAYVLAMILKSDMGKAFPALAEKISRSANERRDAVVDHRR